MDRCRMEISGTLVSDPRVRAVGDGSVTDIRIVSKLSKGRDQARDEYTSISVWGPRGQELAQKLRKGSYIYATGLEKSTRKGNDDVIYTTFTLSLDGAIYEIVSDGSQTLQARPMMPSGAPANENWVEAARPSRPAAPRFSQPVESEDPDELPF